MIGVTPDITAVTVVRHGVLRLTFADGMTGEADVLDRIRGPVFERAGTEAGFIEVFVDSETGTVAWPGGQTSPRRRSTSACVRSHGPTKK
jgi:hypothetical protein